MAADPLILPSLLANRGFTSGLLLGLAFFAAVNGLAYVISLFFQTALGLTPRRGGDRPAPAHDRHHHRLLRLPPAGREARPDARRSSAWPPPWRAPPGLWATVLAEGTAVSLWAVAPSILVLGVGMGACFSSIYDVAIGDVAPGRGGQRQRLALSAVQQLAAAIGSAVVTTVYFSQRTHHGAAHAMTVSVAVVGAIAAPGPRPRLAAPENSPAGTALAVSRVKPAVTWQDDYRLNRSDASSRRTHGWQVRA